MKQLTQQEYDSLVALAKYGYKCLHGLDEEADIHTLGLVREIEDKHGHKYAVPTELAKLPEGL